MSDRRYRLLPRALSDMHAPLVRVEVHLANGLPAFNLVGLPEIEVKESRERVRAALQNAQFGYPTSRRITVNLAPADLPKESGRFDLPIAIGILVATEQVPRHRLHEYEFAGELGLSGELRPIRGALAMTLKACGMDAHSCCRQRARAKRRLFVTQWSCPRSRCSTSARI